ncbi:hypothetical protein BV20DRAFT_961892 [Pilatotrama ljubarskyi]|nr:hypothetical protein BV20DRAFT_961892 [Pilatotrama ljubarskyi]
MSRIASFTHFDFPVYLADGGPEIAAGLRLDLQPVGFTSLKAHAFRTALPRLKALNIYAPREDSSLIQDALDQQMQFLKHLRIKTTEVDFDDYQPIPVFSLLSINILSLETLVVRHSFVNLDTTLAYNLRRLHLENYRDLEEDIPFRWPIANFLFILSNCARLEELIVKNYLDVTVVGRNPSLRVLPLSRLTKLKEVTIKDKPYIVSRILSHLLIPAHVDAEVVGYITDGDAHSAFRTMLPADRNKLPILYNAPTIRVFDTQDQCCVMSALISDEVAFDMELRRGTVLEARAGFTSARRDGSLFRSMIECMDIFEGAPATKLQISGTLGAVPRVSWIKALESFPDVREIELTDVPDEQRPDSLSAILSALASESSVARGQVVSARLWRLRIKAAIHDNRLLNGIYECVKGRAQAGAPLLHTLELELFPRRVWAPVEVARCEQALAALATLVRLNIHRPEDWQGGSFQ